MGPTFFGPAFTCDETMGFQTNASFSYFLPTLPIFSMNLYHEYHLVAWAALSHECVIPQNADSSPRLVKKATTSRGNAGRRSHTCW